MLLRSVLDLPRWWCVLLSVVDGAGSCPDQHFAEIQQPASWISAHVESEECGSVWVVGVFVDGPFGGTVLSLSDP